MWTDERRYVLRLISEGEHEQQDFKYRVEDAEKLARSVSAFANTRGGRLLIGVRDDGVVSGVRSEEEIYIMHQAAYKYCRPEASIKFDTFHVDGRTVVIATVPPSERRPVMAFEEGKEERAVASAPQHGRQASGGRWRAFIRIADENIVASPVHLAIWREEQALRGASFTYGDNERQLMAAMTGAGPLRLNAIVKRSQLPRREVTVLLGRLCRYGLVQWQLREHEFVFALV